MAERKKRTAERDIEIYFAWRIGIPQAYLAREHGLSRERVRQIVWRLLRKLDRPEWERRIWEKRRAQS